MTVHTIETVEDATAILSTVGALGANISAPVNTTVYEALSIEEDTREENFLGVFNTHEAALRHIVNMLIRHNDPNPDNILPGHVIDRIETIHADSDWRTRSAAYSEAMDEYFATMSDNDIIEELGESEYYVVRSSKIGGIQPRRSFRNN